MFYTMQITAEIEKDRPARVHRPCTIETFTNKKDSVTDMEIDMVAEAFKQQLKDLLTAMVRTDA